MNEQWALEAIKTRKYIREGIEYDIVKVPYSTCDECAFEEEKTCPHEICNSAGMHKILLKSKTQNKEKL